ncbi:MAG: MFS transporter [Halodesulfurarchaeum sp.]
MSHIADDRKQATLAVLSGGNFAQLGVRLLIGALVPFILVTFQASKSAVGLALTGMWATYALFQFPSGVLADRFSERPLVILGLGGAAIGTFLVGVSPTLLLFGVCTILLGAGAGLYFAPATTLISRVFEEQGGAIGALTATGAAAGIVFPAGGSLLGARLGWRPVLWLASGITLLFLLAIYRWVPELPPANPDRNLGTIVDRSRLRATLTSPSIAYTTVVAVMGGFAFQAFSSFFPTFLVEYHRMTTGMAGVLFGVVFGLSTVAQPIAGGLSDRIGRDTAIGMSMVLFASGLLVLLSVSGWLGLGAGVVLLGTGLSWPGTMQARFMDELEESERGYGYGLARTVYMGIAASGSVVVGTLAEVAGWVFGYGVVVVVLTVCLGVLAANRMLGFDL